MAWTAHSDPKMMEQLSETPEDLQSKSEHLAAMIASAKRVVVFTGAGVSTAAGIADYRGPDGVWTLSAKGEQHKIKSIDMMKAVPTLTHMALVKLLEQGSVRHLISQNVDGLHRKSGVRKSDISELHGNTHIEYCNRCRREYLRDFNVTQGQRAGGRSIELPTGFDHRTGRACEVPGCTGLLEDNIIHFGENLPEEVIKRGFSESEEADLHIVLGSSLTVSPACHMPLATKRGAPGNKFVIVNLQKTPLDDDADLLIRSPLNDVMRIVTKALGIDIPAFKITRKIATFIENGKPRATAVDEDNIPTTLLKSTEHVDGNIHLAFYGHYDEPTLTLPFTPTGYDQHPKEDLVSYRTIQYDPIEGATKDDKEWTVTDSTVYQRSAGHSAPRIEDAKQGKGGAGSGSTPSTSAPIVDDTDYSSWFAVTPKEHCPHCEEVTISDELSVNLKAPCVDCGNVGENMLCLGCNTVRCGRHVQEHMLMHHLETSHPIVAGFIDLTFWCYPCESYIVPSNRCLSPYYIAFHTAKFGVPPAMARGVRVVEE